MKKRNKLKWYGIEHNRRLPITVSVKAKNKTEAMKIVIIELKKSIKLTEDNTDL